MLVPELACTAARKSETGHILIKRTLSIANGSWGQRDAEFMTLDAKRARYLESDGGKNRDKGIEPFIFHSFIYVSPFVAE